MIATLVTLARDDLGLYSVALVLLGVAVGMAFLAICLAWDRAGDRLDAMIDDAPDLDGNVRFYESRPGSER